MKTRFFAQVDSSPAAAPAAEPVKPVENTPAAPEVADIEKPTEPAAAAVSEADEIVRPTSGSTILFVGIFVLVAGGVIFYAMGGARIARRVLATRFGVGQSTYRKLASEEP